MAEIITMLFMVQRVLTELVDDTAWVQAMGNCTKFGKICHHIWPRQIMWKNTSVQPYMQSTVCDCKWLCNLPFESLLVVTIVRFEQCLLKSNVSQPGLVLSMYSHSHCVCRWMNKSHCSTQGCHLACWSTLGLTFTDLFLDSPLMAEEWDQSLLSIRILSQLSLPQPVFRLY